MQQHVNTQVWKSAKYIEVQYSTDKAFEKCKGEEDREGQGE